MLLIYLAFLLLTNTSCELKEYHRYKSTSRNVSEVPSSSASQSSSDASRIADDAEEPRMSSSDIAQRLSQAHFEFTLKVYRALVAVSSPKDNVIFSPLLISTLLTPVLLSARDLSRVLVPAVTLYGKNVYPDNNENYSAVPVLMRYDRLSGVSPRLNENIRIQRAAAISKQIQQVLNFNNLTLRSIEAWHKATVATLQDAYYRRLLSAPRGLLLLQKELDKRMQKILQKWFDDTVRKVDLPVNATKIADEINRWSKGSTSNQIKDLVSESLLKRMTSLLLSPAYIGSMWLNEFDVNKTFLKGLFYRSSSERFEIPIMIGRFHVPIGYSPALEARVLELPFHNRRASLFILLPDNIDPSRSILERNITSENVRALLSTLKDETVNLRIPRFFVDSTPPMIKALKHLGVEDLFIEIKSNTDSWQRDRSSQVPPDLLLHDFIHRVKFKMEERYDTDDASSRSDLNSQTRLRKSPSEERIGAFGEKYFEVDHPFMFFLWDYIASTVICMGRVVNPHPIYT